MIILLSSRITFAFLALLLAAGVWADESPAQWYQDGKKLVAERRAAIGELVCCPVLIADICNKYRTAH